MFVICCGGKSRLEKLRQKHEEKWKSVNAGLSTLSEDILLEYSIPTLEKLYDRVSGELNDFKDTDFTDAGGAGLKDRTLARMEKRLQHIE